MKKIINFLVEQNLVPIILLLCLVFALLGSITTLKGEIKRLIAANEYKREIIECYEQYYDATERICSDGAIDSLYWTRAKERLDSLYATQE